MRHEMCSVCGSTTTERFLTRGHVPVHQNLLFASARQARAIKRGRLDMRACASCGFIFNAAFDPQLLDYGPDYENSQDVSPTFSAHLDRLVEYLVTDRGVRGGRVVEIGCGKGVFLTRLVGHPANHGEAVGFDPAYRGPEAVGRARFVRGFYGPETAVSADVVVCRHVIEHIAEPLELLATIRRSTGGSGTTRLFLETPCAEWILRNRVPWDFFYEHCSLFSADSLRRALTLSGYTVVEVRHVFGGQYLWAEAIAAAGRASPDTDEPDHHHDPDHHDPGANRDGPDASELVRLARRFTTEEQACRDYWRSLLAERARCGPVYAWGAGAKGVTFCNLVDPGAERLAGVVDVNPAKQGKFLPGTGHAIVSPAAAVEAGAASFLVFNPNYVEEIRATVARLGSTAAVIDPLPEAAACDL